MSVSLSLTQGSTPQTSGTLTLNITGATAGDAVVLLNGTTDVTSSFDVSPSTIPASGPVIYTAKVGKFKGTETLSITAKLTDAGSPFTSNAVTSPIDTSAPTSVTIKQGTSSNTANQITFTAPEAGDVVQIFNDTTDITSSFTISNNNLNYTLTANATTFTGTEALSLSVYLTDAAGNVSNQSNILNTTIDTTPPNSVKIAQGAKPKATNLITFTAPEAGDTIKVFTDNTDITDKFTISNNNLNYTLIANPLSFNGSEALNLSVYLMDDSGNISKQSNLIKTTIDTTGPASPTLTSLSIIKVNQPVLNGTSELGATVNAYQDGNLIGSAVADAKSGIFHITPSSYVAIGDSTIHISSVDVSGNTSLQDTLVNFSIGGVGFDKPYSVNSLSKNYTLAYGQGIVAMTNHDDNSVDNVINFNSINFSDKSLNIINFQKAASLTSSQLKDLSLVYVGYFNRAPDSEGLIYWASRMSDGMSLKDISKSFFYQPETDNKYSSNLSISDFITNTYTYVLGRTPDAKGLTYWTTQLKNGAIDRDSFVLSIINGARASTGSTTDTQFLSNKSTVAYNFAINNGLNDVVWASDVMSKVTDAYSTVVDANAKINSYVNTASDIHSSEIMIKLVGIN